MSNVSRPLRTPHSALRIITIGHTPDLDDAFMFYAMAAGRTALDGIKIEHVIQDIQTLNQRASNADLDVTAVSVASYPFIVDKYWPMAVGASVGQDYGPLVVSTTPYSVEELRGRRIAVPGLQTTAYLVLRLAVPEFMPVTMSFEQIPEAVLGGHIDAGLLIHEKQLTYHDQGLLPILDLGVWWHTTTGLPLPLGLNVVKRSLGEPLAAHLTQALRESILYAMTHQDEALTGSMQFGRGIDLPRARQFVGMYVNEETLALSAKSRTAIELLYRRAHELKLLPSIPQITWIEPRKL